jgi:tetratricopeptide (TPR) repeat protein
MHSFWAQEAERSFLQAAALDPEAPMPYFGVAMVAAGDWRPRFQIDQLDEAIGKQKPSRNRATDAAAKALELSAAPGKVTDIEKLYIEAVAARRDLKSADPDEAFVTGLRRVLAKYPDEVEAKTYLALMIMRGFTLPAKAPRAPGTTEAVAILRELAVKTPDHPGVHHYIIHGFEGSTFATDAWPSCKRYAELVPNIPHALHMPGHIYSQTGKWAEATAAFAAAAKNELGYMQADALYGSGHHGHNVHYLATAYSFQGEYDKAMEAARGLLAYKENPRLAKQADSFTGTYQQGWFATMRTMVQFGKWDELLKGDTLPVPLKPRQIAWQHWALGVANAEKGNAAAARQELIGMDAALADYRQRTGRVDPPELLVARKELEGHINVASGHAKKGLKTLEAAAREERHLRYSEPPYYPRPVNEGLGQDALRLGKLNVAEKAFRSALEQYPASYHAQTGLKLALQRGDKPIEAGQ